MQGTLYTSGIGKISGTDCAHVPLWITYTDGRCRQLLWGVMTGFRRRRVPWEFRESLVVTQVVTEIVTIIWSMSNRAPASGGSSTAPMHGPSTPSMHESSNEEDVRQFI